MEEEMVKGGYIILMELLKKGFGKMIKESILIKMKGLLGSKKYI